MQQLQTYRCDGCESKYHVAAGEDPIVLCPDCKQIADRWDGSKAKQEYQIGHAKYTEARRRLTQAVNQLESGKTTLARGGFNDAADELQDSVDHFRTATQTATDHDLTDQCEQARDKATCLWQAAEWLSGASYATEQNNSEKAQRFQRDARTRFEAAAEYGTIPEPDELVDTQSVCRSFHTV
jgi:exonuclease VII small subunit